jgi:DNA polymerase (family 10)
VNTRVENAHIARLLSETADLMEIAAEDPFRIRSYRNAAAAIQGAPERVVDLLNDPARKVTDIPGIGKGIAAIIAEIAARGSFERRDQLLERYPPTALEFLKIQGLGPKSIALIWEHYRATTIDDLERLAREQKLRELPRMGAKLEEKILRSIAQYRRSAGRFLMNAGLAVAEEIADCLRTAPGVARVTAAGSLRRAKETVGDIDLLVTGPDPESALEAFVKHPKIDEVLARGVNKASARVGPDGIQVDVRTLPEDSYGAALQYFTGSKDHNVVLRTRAVRMGLSLNEYGLTEAATGAVIVSRTEEEIYGRLGLDWIPPELRENYGEIEAAERHELPALVELGDLRGDLHMHTTESDGRATLPEMAEAAAALGHEYIAITDHSKALAMANGLNEERVVAFARRVRSLRDLPVRVFSGIECDVLRDGKMDLANDALAELDLVVASIHGYLNLESSEMTERYLAAIENPYVRIIGHPTGRVLLRREGFAFDYDRVFAAAAARGVAMEINSSPERLDLGAELIRAAKTKGCRFVVSTDAHHPRHLAGLRFGVATARRGWLTKNDILNAQPLAGFAAWVANRAR